MRYLMGQNIIPPCWWITSQSYDIICVYGYKRPMNKYIFSPASAQGGSPPDGRAGASGGKSTLSLVNS